MSGNVIIRSNTATPAKSLESVREVLGVRLADNLQSADVVLLAEGKHDCIALQAILAERSHVLSMALDQGRLRLQGAGGASTAAYQFRQYYDMICSVHLLLDDDKSGRDAVRKLELEPGFDTSMLTVVSAVGMNECEFEDLVDPSLYEDLLMKRFNVDASLDGATHAVKKFSHRLQDMFKASGQVWSSSVEGDVKAAIGEAVVASPGTALRVDRVGPIDALVRALESKF